MWKLNTNFFEIPPIGWSTFGAPAAPVAEVQPAFANDESKKQAFGIALARQGEITRDSAFQAGLEIFDEQTGPALWVSHHWMNDPTAIAAYDIYLKSLKVVEKPLDKEGVAAKLLALADEKIERNGQKFYVHEAKDRIAALKAYSEVLGYTGKVNIDNSINKSVQNNVMEIVLIKSDNQNDKKIVEKEETENDVIDLDIVPLEIKLVS